MPPTSFHMAMKLGSPASTLLRTNSPGDRVLQGPQEGAATGGVKAEGSATSRRREPEVSHPSRAALTSSSNPKLARGRYRRPVSSQRVPDGVVHMLPADLRHALIANTTALGAWKDITPLARNEFICWVEDAKQETTRARRIRRTQEELEEGQRRPCCWPGCKHRERTGR